jgi:hypothetical protein
MKISKDLQGIYPGFKIAGLLAEQTRALADYWEKFPGTHWTR